MGKSSKDHRDIYYRLAKERGYRARSVFKLIHLNHHYQFLTPQTTKILDLCAAPGSWSQVLISHLQHLEDSSAVAVVVTDDDGNATAASDIHKSTDKLLVAVDLQPIAPLPGVTTLQLDITLPSTIDLLKEYFPADSAPADLVVTDGAPDVTGSQDLDSSLHYQLYIASLTICRHLLKPHGVFVGKVFQGEGVEVIRVVSEQLFERVSFRKPEGSRATSKELFVICEGFRGSLQPTTTTVVEGKASLSEEQVQQVYESWEIGDLSGYNG